MSSIVKRVPCKAAEQLECKERMSVAICAMPAHYSDPMFTANDI